MGRARIFAYDVLDRWRRRMIDTIDQAPWEEIHGRDRGLAREILLGTLRHLRLYDHLIDQALPKEPAPPLRTALRLGAQQLFGMDGIAVHAAVAETVDILKWVKQPRFVGVCNAVLRRWSRERVAETGHPILRLPPALRPIEPGICWSLPDALVDDLRPVLPDGQTARLIDLQSVAPLTTRTRPGRPDPADDPAIIRREGPWTWWRRPQPALRGPVASGDAVVQDRSQALAIELARVQAGERVLDLCAAPGGKSMLLQDLGAHLISADSNPRKKTRLQENLGPGRILIQDGRQPALAPVFDLVVVDAPCSNTGVLARRPEARWRYDEASLASLTDLQDQLLAQAASLVRPAGRILYSTCSLTPAENGERVQALVGWAVEREELHWPNALQAGGYAAVLRRQDAAG